MLLLPKLVVGVSLSQTHPAPIPVSPSVAPVVFVQERERDKPGSSEGPGRREAPDRPDGGREGATSSRDGAVVGESRDFDRTTPDVAHQSRETIDPVRTLEMRETTSVGLQPLLGSTSGVDYERGSGKIAASLSTSSIKDAANILSGKGLLPGLSLGASVATDGAVKVEATASGVVVAITGTLTVWPLHKAGAAGLSVRVFNASMGIEFPREVVNESLIYSLETHGRDWGKY